MTTKNAHHKMALVTGADGFIGSHLVEELLKRGYQVKALSQYNSFNFWGWIEDLPFDQNLSVISGDIRDAHFCREITKNVDIIFHLAALIAIPFSYKAAESYIDTNVKGTLNMCMAAMENGNIRFINTSTSEVYGTALYVPIDEKHPRQPQSPYSASKIAADAVSMSFYNAFGLPLSIVRPFNTFGPRQSARAIIPSIIIQIANGKNEIMLGDLTPTRDFNYVKDTCSGFVAVAENDSTIGRELNLCSGTEISMLDTLMMIKEIMNSDVEFVTDKSRLRPDKSEVFRLLGDNRLIRKLTGFTSEFNIRSGLEKTCEWFTIQDNIRKYKADIYNI
jgi:NAD dependent epimerase/dehydratase